MKAPKRSKPRRSKIPFRNRNQSGWWIFSEVEYFVSSRQPKLTDNSRCLTWENTRLIRADSRDEAYRKAMRLAQVGQPCKTKLGEWRSAGISMLLPVYEDMEDGVEILWVERGRMPFRRIKRLAKSKKRLPVFDDREPM